MSCKGQEMPTLGILGMTAHKIGKLAQTMYAEYDLNKSQSMILFQLHRDGRISQKELAQKLNVSAPSITSMIQKMEKSGYIVRNVDEKDQRMMRLDLTEKGQAQLNLYKIEWKNYSTKIGSMFEDVGRNADSGHMREEN